MFDKIEVPQGVEPVVNGQIKAEKRFSVSKNDQVYFVNFAPAVIPISVSASCNEGVPLTLSIEVRVEIPKANLTEASRDWGCADRRRPVSINTAEIVKRTSLIECLKSCVTTFIRDASFFALEKRQGIDAQLQQTVQNECARARLQGELLSWDRQIPVLESEYLGRLRADPDHTEIADYFLGQRRHTQDVDDEISNIEKQMKIKRETDTADIKLAQQLQNDRVDEGAAAMQQKADERAKISKERNRDLLLLSAQYNVEVAQREREDKMKLAKLDAELVKESEPSRIAEREQKRLDIEVDEGQRAKMRIDEFKQRIAAMNTLLASVKDMPTQDMSNVHTLVGEVSDMRSKIVGVFAKSLEKLLGDSETPNVETRSKLRP